MTHEIYADTCKYFRREGRVVWPSSFWRMYVNKIKELFGKEPLNTKSDAPFILYYKDGSIKFVNMDRDCEILCEYQDAIKECCFEIKCDRTEDGCSYMYLEEADIKGLAQYLMLCLQMMR